MVTKLLHLNINNTKGKKLILITFIHILVFIWLRIKCPEIFMMDRKYIR